MKIDLKKIFENLDSTTYNHSLRVMSLAREFEQYIGSLEYILSSSALVHDIGKSLISFKILDKAGKLSEIEKKIVSLHPYIGYALLKEFDIREDICQIVLYHHGMKPIVLSDISDKLECGVEEKALMLHTIDVYEALTSDRPYHSSLPLTRAIDVIKTEMTYHEEVLDFLQKSIKFKNESTSIDKRYYERDIALADKIISHWGKVIFA